MLNCNGNNPIIDLYMKQYVCKLFISLSLKILSLLHKGFELEFHLAKVMALMAFLLRNRFWIWMDQLKWYYSIGGMVKLKYDRAIKEYTDRDFSLF